MLSQRFATPLRLQVNHSRRLRAVVISFFILSLLALLLAQFSLLLKLPIILGVVGLFFSAWRARPELAGETVELILRPNGAWLLERKGESIALQLHGQSTVSRWLLLLCFKETHGVSIICCGRSSSRPFCFGVCGSICVSIPTMRCVKLSA